MDFSNVNTDAKGYAVPVPSSVELEDVHKPPVQPVPEDGQADTVDLDDKALHGRKRDSRRRDKGEQEESSEELPEEAYSREELEEAVGEIQKHFQAMASSFIVTLQVDRQSGFRIELKDMKTNEVVRQISPGEIMRLRKKMLDMTGLLFDKKI
ncbi:MAG: flagellar protein FlaG [Desulfobulbaceae bacterium]|uniref:Flagellar protein FlaG n=1 Tax=Candidatus Desulfobia pelagia TaxID=2841692 RepID=A0A8J6NBW1_9BACT|nr:flagellar protein FlaG [Candidatus Desulfobia pelagia]